MIDERKQSKEEIRGMQTVFMISNCNYLVF